MRYACIVRHLGEFPVRLVCRPQTSKGSIITDSILAHKREAERLPGW